MRTKQHYGEYGRVSKVHMKSLRWSVLFDASAALSTSLAKRTRRKWSEVINYAGNVTL
ncbi:MAG: hypothetical protein IPF68_14365 [Bacteroidales bacterium]|nr:hypothetical protein [Bacteroidales bacterium]